MQQGLNLKINEMKKNKIIYWISTHPLMYNDEFLCFFVFIF